MSLYERRHSSLLGLAGKTTTRSEVTSNCSINHSLLAASMLNKTYTISDSEENSSKDFSKYPSQLKSSLDNVSVITSKWSELSQLELEMSGKFNNISNSAADLVNQLTRETACKAGCSGQSFHLTIDRSTNQSQK